jgi:hypothetical protein
MPSSSSFNQANQEADPFLLPFTCQRHPIQFISQTMAVLSNHSNQGSFCRYDAIEYETTSTNGVDRHRGLYDDLLDTLQLT